MHSRLTVADVEAIRAGAMAGATNVALGVRFGICPEYASDTQLLRVYIGQLRSKIEERPERPAYILTEPGIGYRFREEA